MDQVVAQALSVYARIVGQKRAEATRAEAVRADGCRPSSPARSGGSRAFSPRPPPASAVRKGA